MIDLCLDAGVTLFDPADVYSTDLSETTLGEALRGNALDAASDKAKAYPHWRQESTFLERNPPPV